MFNINCGRANDKNFFDSIDALKYWKMNYIKKEERLPKKYIINDKATILLWNDGTKTVIKRSEGDEYNKTLAFLWAYFQKTSGLSKTKANEYLKCLKDYNDISLNNVVNVLKEPLANMCDVIGNSFKITAKNLRK